LLQIKPLLLFVFSWFHYSSTPVSVSLAHTPSRDH